MLESPEDMHTPKPEPWASIESYFCTVYHVRCGFIVSQWNFMILRINWKQKQARCSLYLWYILWLASLFMEKEGTLQTTTCLGFETFWTQILLFLLNGDFFLKKLYGSLIILGSLISAKQLNILLKWLYSLWRSNMSPFTSILMERRILLIPFSSLLL